MSNNIKELKTKKLTWISIDHATAENLKFLKNEFQLDTNDLNECLPTRQRQKIREGNGQYIFIVLQFPYYNPTTEAIEGTEVDIFIGKKFLVTIHDGELKPLLDLFHICQTDQLVKSQIENEDVLSLLYRLIHSLYQYCYPILNHINFDIDALEKDILGKAEEATIRDILQIKRNIVNYQKTLQAHRNIWQKFIEITAPVKMDKKTNEGFKTLLFVTRDIWDYLTNYKDTINALHETQESMTSLKINEIMKTLTIFSVVVFPLTLLAAIFGMNTIDSMPFVDQHHGFWYVIGIMAIGMLIMFTYFRKRKWI